MCVLFIPLCLPSFVLVLCYIDLVPSVLSSFATNLLRKRKPVALLLWNSCLYVSVFACVLMSLPHGAVGWTVICNCCIF